MAKTASTDDRSTKPKDGGVGNEAGPADGKRRFTVLYDVKHDGTLYEPGATIVVDRTTFDELKAVHAVEGDWTD